MTRNHAADTVASLKRMKGSVDPILDGPVIRKDSEGWFYVDIATASRRLLWRLTVGRYGGDAPNARAQHFESSVQKSIDGAGFGPGAAWRSLIGRQLKRSGGTTITDVDAISVIGDTLLLIDAKSYPYTAEYGAGQYNAVKNVTDKLTLDLEKWDDRVSQIREAPVGPNYDFTAAARIFGLVVTPFPCYLPLPLAEQETLPGLRAASSLDELRSYLDTLPTEGGS